MPKGNFTASVADMWAAVKGRIGAAVDSGAGASSRGMQTFADMANSSCRTLDAADRLSPIGVGWHNGQLVSFEFADVLSTPMRDHRGRMIGVALPRNGVQLASFRRWASVPDRRSDTQYIDGRGSPESQALTGPTLTARWANLVRATDIPPKYVLFHADKGHAEIQVAQAGTVYQVTTPGEVLGNYLAHNPFYRVTSEANPKGPTVLLACNSASSGAKTGKDVITALEAHDAVSGPAYGAKGVIEVSTDPGSYSFMSVQGPQSDDIYDDPFERLR